jgi:mannose-6-phosphate isomerase-like protein (cupin superfamily)
VEEKEKEEMKEDIMTFVRQGVSHRLTKTAF